MSRLIWHGDKILKKLNKEVESNVEKIKNAIVKRAKQFAVVKTGELRDSIGVTDDGIEVTADYAGPVEFGTSKKAARPFLRPAIELSNENDLM